MPDDNDDMYRGHRPGGGLVPIPDPTKLTMEMVSLAKRELEKLFDTKIAHVDEDVQRIEKMLSELPSMSDAKLDRFKELLDQKFTGVATEFSMRDIALAAAFKAAEAAVQQQNLSTTIASDKLASAFSRQIDNLSEKIDGLKENVNEIARKNWSTVGGYIVGAIGVAALIIAAIYHSPVH